MTWMGKICNSKPRRNIISQARLHPFFRLTCTLVYPFASFMSSTFGISLRKKALLKEKNFVNTFLARISKMEDLK